MLRLHSRLLGEDIICLEEGEKAPRSPGCVVYSRGELEAMGGLGPDMRKAIHKAKKYFGGRYVGQAPQVP